MIEYLLCGVGKVRQTTSVATVITMLVNTQTPHLSTYGDIRRFDDVLTLSATESSSAAPCSKKSVFYNIQSL